MAKHENCGGEIVDGDPSRCLGCKTVGYATKRLDDGAIRLYSIDDVHRLSAAMWKIIETRSNTERNPINDKLSAGIYSEEIYRELIASGFDIPDGEMYKIFSSWQNQRMDAIEFGGEGQTTHGNVKIIKVFPRIG